MEQKRVLIVDDEFPSRLLMRVILERAGFFVAAAENGFMAWEMLQGQAYDVIISDQQMPEISGLELLRKIGEASIFANVLFVLVAFQTEYNSDDDFSKWCAECKKWNGNGVIRKPFNPAVFVQLVNYVLNEPELFFDLSMRGSSLA